MICYRLLLILCVSLIPLLADADSVIHEGTDDNSFALQGSTVHGWDFETAQPLRLTALGYWDFGMDGVGIGSNGQVESYELGLWDTSSQTLLASVIISDDDPLDTQLTVEGGQWRYESLATQVTLQSGNTYTLGFRTPTGGLGALDFDETLMLDYGQTITNHAGVSLPQVDRFLASSTLVFPVNVAPTPFGLRANVNARVFSVPEPASFGVILIAGSAILLSRRKSLFPLASSLVV